VDEGVGDFIRRNLGAIVFIYYLLMVV
jgi:hypothetical protein